MLKIKIPDLEVSTASKSLVTKEEIEKGMRLCIQKVADQQSISLERMEAQHRIVEDLGFSSLDVATLTAVLEEEFHVDPFSNNMASITDIRTVGDICSLYDRCLNLVLKPVPEEVVNEVEDARLKRRRMAGGR